MKLNKKMQTEMKKKFDSQVNNITASMEIKRENRQYDLNLNKKITIIRIPS